MTPDTAIQRRASWKSAALPAQHGAWGFWLEPALAGLLAAPSWAGLWLACAALALLLLHHPLLIMLKDWRRGKVYARTRQAALFSLLYFALAAGGVLLAWNQAGVSLLLAAVWAAPFAAVQLWYELGNEQRALAAEISGAAAFATLAPAIVIGADGAPALAVGLWMALVVRAVTSILYVRERLRQEKGKPANRRLVHAAHAVGGALLALLAAFGLVSWMAVVAMMVLVVRALLGLVPARLPTPAKIIGFRELGYGILFAAAAGIGGGQL